MLDCRSFIVFNILVQEKLLVTGLKCREVYPIRLALPLALDLSFVSHVAMVIIMVM